MNEQQKRGSLLKPLAIVGFIGIIILIAWLSVQLVRVAPGAFASLASLAESLNKDQSLSAEATKQTVPLTVTSNTTLSNTGEEITISWGTPSVPGTFTFSYACTEGIAIDLVNVDGLRSIDCDTNYNIGNVTDLTITVDSAKERYADVTYTISFLGTNDTVPRASGSAVLTIVNSAIQNILVTAPDMEAAPEPVWTEPVSPAPTPTVVPPRAEENITVTPAVTPVVTPTPTAPPTYEQEFIYTIPTSDPQGRTDLSVRFLDTGMITNETFTTGAVRSGDQGAIRFEVKNLGTKTSGTWSYSVTLPTGSRYESSAQLPLKPNERAVLTIGFPTGTETEHRFVVLVNEATDQNRSNDRFEQPITFVR